MVSPPWDVHDHFHLPIMDGTTPRRKESDLNSVTNRHVASIMILMRK